MPKAPVHEDDGSTTGEDQIWPAGQIAAMKAVSEAHGMDHPSDRHFGLRVASANAPHAL